MNHITPKVRGLVRPKFDMVNRFTVWLLAPVIAILAGLALNFADHEKINSFLALAVVVAGSAPIFYILNRLLHSRPADDSLSLEAVQRIRRTCSYLLDFYG